MNRSNVLKLLGILGSEVTKKEGKWVTAHCPFAAFKHESGIDHNPSFGIAVAPESRYHCFSCTSSGDILDLLHELDDKGVEFDMATAMQLVATELDDDLELDAPDYEEAGPKKLTPWPEEYLNTFPRALLSSANAKYLRSRGMSFSVAQQLDFRVDNSRQRICVPIRDFGGRLMGLHGRDLTGQQKLKYLSYGYHGERNPDVWLGEHWIDFEQPVLVVESVFDLAKALFLYPNTMTPLSAGVSKIKAQRLAAASEVITLYDNDLAGREGHKQLAAYLPDVPTIELRLPAGIGDPGEAPYDVLAEVFKGAELDILEKC